VGRNGGPLGRLSQASRTSVTLLEHPVKGSRLAKTAARRFRRDTSASVPKGNIVGRIGGEGREWDGERRERKDRLIYPANRRLTRRPETV
jgi:hypothetical protein